MATHIKNIVNTIIEPTNEKAWQIHMLSNWDSIIGDLKTHVRLEKIQNDILFLGVYDSCWMQELFLLSNVIIKNINSKLDQPRIRQIKFKKAEFTKKIEKQKQKKIIYKKVELSSQELLTLKRIKDQDLAEELKKFLIRCHQQRQDV